MPSDTTTLTPSKPYNLSDFDTALVQQCGYLTAVMRSTRITV